MSRHRFHTFESGQEALAEAMARAQGKPAGIELAVLGGHATLIVRGTKPFIAEIKGFHKEFRYEREFLGWTNRQRTEVSLVITTMPLPKLFDIRADGRAYYCIHESGAPNAFRLTEIDEMMLRELIQAREFAKDWDVGLAAKATVKGRKSEPVKLASGRVISFDD